MKIVKIRCQLPFADYSYKRKQCNIYVNPRPSAAAVGLRLMAYGILAIGERRCAAAANLHC